MMIGMFKFFNILFMNVFTVYTRQIFNYLSILIYIYMYIYFFIYAKDCL